MVKPLVGCLKVTVMLIGVVKLMSELLKVVVKALKDKVMVKALKDKVMVKAMEDLSIIILASILAKLPFGVGLADHAFSYICRLRDQLQAYEHIEGR